MEKNHRAGEAKHGVVLGFGIDASLTGSPIYEYTRNELELLLKKIELVTYRLGSVSECSFDSQSKSKRIPVSVSVLDLKFHGTHVWSMHGPYGFNESALLDEVR